MNRRSQTAAGPIGKRQFAAMSPDDRTRSGKAKAHAAANISVGNSRETLIEAATLLLPFMGFPRTLNALACIDAATKP